MLSVAALVMPNREEREFENMLVSSIVRWEAYARKTGDVWTSRRGKLSAHDLMTEIEYVISKSSGCMLLLERR